MIFKKGKILWKNSKFLEIQKHHFVKILNLNNQQHIIPKNKHNILADSQIAYMIIYKIIMKNQVNNKVTIWIILNQTKIFNPYKIHHLKTIYLLKKV